MNVSWPHEATPSRRADVRIRTALPGVPSGTRSAVSEDPTLDAIRRISASSGCALPSQARAGFPPAASSVNAASRRSSVIRGA